MAEETEEDVKNRYITPAIERREWAKAHVKMEHCFTDGRVIVRGNSVERGKRKKNEYTLAILYGIYYFLYFNVKNHHKKRFKTVKITDRLKENAWTKKK